MQHMTSRDAMLASLLFGLASNPAQKLFDSLRRESAPTHEPIHNHRSRRGTRYQGTPRIRRPAPYSQPSPKSVTGMRLRWECGKLVPRDAVVMGRPLTKRAADRALAKRRKLDRPKKTQPLNGGNRRDDLKGVMRAARRAGIVSARQQRRIHRGIREGGIAAPHLAAMLKLEAALES